MLSYGTYWGMESEYDFAMEPQLSELDHKTLIDALSIEHDNYGSTLWDRTDTCADLDCICGPGISCPKYRQRIDRAIDMIELIKHPTLPQEHSEVAQSKPPIELVTNSTIIPEVSEAEPPKCEFTPTSDNRGIELISAEELILHYYSSHVLNYNIIALSLYSVLILRIFNCVLITLSVHVIGQKNSRCLDCTGPTGPGPPSCANGRDVV